MITFLGFVTLPRGIIACTKYTFSNWCIFLCQRIGSRQAWNIFFPELSDKSLYIRPDKIQILILLLPCTAMMTNLGKEYSLLKYF